MVNLSIRSVAFVLAGAAVALVSSVSYAAIQVNSVSGTWENVLGGTGVVFPTPNEVRWGGQVPVTNDSGYRFDGNAPPLFMVTIDTPFTLGQMTNFNQPIPSGTAITGATLSTLVDLTIDGTPINGLNFKYDFLHNETPNTAPCPIGSTSVCDDVEKALNNIAQSDTFQIDGVDYTIKVTGFQIGGDQATEWLTPEGHTNMANLQAVITKSTPVPEPETYLVLASTLVPALLLSRHRRKASVKA